LAVLDSLHLARPVLVGHSIAGDELSSIASRHPDRVAGLVYLDPGVFGFYDRSNGQLGFEAEDLIKQLEPLTLVRGRIPPEQDRQLIATLRDSTLPGFEGVL
jgi:non-heme chloroperoxidase